MTSDRVGDMITRLRNANLVKTKYVLIPKTKLTLEMARILVQEGFIENFEEIKPLPLYIRIGLKYKEKKHITKLIRISKPGLRVYVNRNEIPRVLGGIGIAILSTSQGIMTDREARVQKIGGEVLCYVW
uniref:Small ribosomal subunit protein uS8c n=1 Tax=Pyramimonas parkeae TaxID=36894 RepID=C0JX18_9CHLO|nr:ribosomal protein S8 [Pyramimonas parkeae]ACJ71138.1 ribosomal protein S8 [Pyramimonas parkeae]